MTMGPYVLAQTVLGRKGSTSLDSDDDGLGNNNKHCVLPAISPRASTNKPLRNKIDKYGASKSCGSLAARQASRGFLSNHNKKGKKGRSKADELPTLTSFDLDSSDKGQKHQRGDSLSGPPMTELKAQKSAPIYSSSHRKQPGVSSSRGKLDDSSSDEEHEKVQVLSGASPREGGAGDKTRKRQQSKNSRSSKAAHSMSRTTESASQQHQKTHNDSATSETTDMEDDDSGEFIWKDDNSRNSDSRANRVSSESERYRSGEGSSRDTRSLCSLESYDSGSNSINASRNSVSSHSKSNLSRVNRRVRRGGQGQEQPKEHQRRGSIGSTGSKSTGSDGGRPRQSLKRHVSSVGERHTSSANGGPSSHSRGEERSHSQHSSLSMSHSHSKSGGSVSGRRSPKDVSLKDKSVSSHGRGGGSVGDGSVKEKSASSHHQNRASVRSQRSLKDSSLKDRSASSHGSVRRRTDQASPSSGPCSQSQARNNLPAETEQVNKQSIKPSPSSDNRRRPSASVEPSSNSHRNAGEGHSSTKNHRSSSPSHINTELGRPNLQRYHSTSQIAVRSGNVGKTAELLGTNLGKPKPSKQGNNWKMFMGAGGVIRSYSNSDDSETSSEDEEHSRGGLLDDASGRSIDSVRSAQTWHGGYTLDSDPMMGYVPPSKIGIHRSSSGNLTLSPTGPPKRLGYGPNWEQLASPARSRKQLHLLEPEDEPFPGFPSKEEALCDLLPRAKVDSLPASLHGPSCEVEGNGKEQNERKVEPYSQQPMRGASKLVVRTCSLRGFDDDEEQRGPLNIHQRSADNRNTCERYSLDTASSFAQGDRIVRTFSLRRSLGDMFDIDREHSNAALEDNEDQDEIISCGSDGWDEDVDSDPGSEEEEDVLEEDRCNQKEVSARKTLKDELRGKDLVESKQRSQSEQPKKTCAADVQHAVAKNEKSAKPRRQNDSGKPSKKSKASKKGALSHLISSVTGQSNPFENSNSSWGELENETGFVENSVSSSLGGSSVSSSVASCSDESSWTDKSKSSSKKGKKAKRNSAKDTTNRVNRDGKTKDDKLKYETEPNKGADSNDGDSAVTNSVKPDSGSEVGERPTRRNSIGGGKTAESGCSSKLKPRRHKSSDGVAMGDGENLRKGRRRNSVDKTPKTDGHLATLTATSEHMPKPGKRDPKQMRRSASLAKSEHNTEGSSKLPAIGNSNDDDASVSNRSKDSHLSSGGKLKNARRKKGSESTSAEGSPPELHRDSTAGNVENCRSSSKGKPRMPLKRAQSARVLDDKENSKRNTVLRTSSSRVRRKSVDPSTKSIDAAKEKRSVSRSMRSKSSSNKKPCEDLNIEPHVVEELHHLMVNDPTAACAMLEGQPLLAKAKDRDGRLLLHVAASLPDLPSDILETVIAAYPGACEVASESNGYTPLHTAVEADVPTSQIKILIKACPRALKLEDSKGQLPLHVAASNPTNTRLKSIRLLVFIYPESVDVENSKGETARKVAKKKKASAEVLNELRSTS